MKIKNSIHVFKQGFAGLIFTVIVGVAIVVTGYLIVNPDQVVEAPEVTTDTTTTNEPATKKPTVKNPVVLPAPDPEPDLPISLPEPEPEPTPDPKPELGPDMQTVELGNEFVLGLGQVATIYNTGIKVKVTGFYNSPCPPNVQCIWAGQGVELSVSKGNEVKTGTDLSYAFEHTITVKKSDFETYVVLVVEKK